MVRNYFYETRRSVSLFNPSEFRPYCRPFYFMIHEMLTESLPHAHADTHSHDHTGASRFIISLFCISLHNNANCIYLKDKFILNNTVINILIEFLTKCMKCGMVCLQTLVS